MPLVWLGLIMAGLFALAFFLKQSAAKGAAAAPRAPAPAPGPAPAPAAGAKVSGLVGEGRAPYPAARLIDFPGGAMRVVDLRSLPREDLVVGKLGVAQQQIAIERPIGLQIWVVDIEIARGWAALTETARFLVAQRLRDPRSTTTQNFLYPHGGKLEKAESDALAAVGLEVILELTNFGPGAPTRDLNAFLDPPEPWAEAPDRRPVPPFKVISTGPFDGDLVHVLAPFAYVDLRRIVPGALANGVGLGRIETALDSETMALATHVIWCASPWVLEQFPEKDLPRLLALVDTQRDKQQRLALIAPADEPLPDNAVARALKAKLSPIAERFQWKTQDGRVFHVRPTDALHDAYFTHAWKQPRL
jgi:hypothetical protein